MSVLVDDPDLRVELTERGVFFVAVDGESSMRTLDVDDVLDRIQPHLEEHAKVRYLVDARRVGTIPLADRWRLSERMKENRPFILRSAVFGLPLHLEFPLRVILRVSGRKDLHVFRTREDAETWLTGA